MNGGIIEFREHVLFAIVEVEGGHHEKFAIDFVLLEFVGFFLHGLDWLEANQKEDYNHGLV